MSQVEKYTKGTLKVASGGNLEDEDFDYCFLPKGTVYLPHSCDEWVVGGPDEAKALIADLQLYLDGKL